SGRTDKAIRFLVMLPIPLICCHITFIQKISKYFAVGIAEKNPSTAKGSGNQGEKVLKFYC
uniref:hypothetical protein n=1 Tax=Acinetobacter soli TaxID=487316 RepID=UPI001C092CDA